MSYLCYAQTSVPKNIYKQNEIKDFLKSIWSDKNEHELIEKFFASTGVKSRGLALPLEEYQKLGHFGNRNNLWKKEAISLQKKNIEDIFNKVKISSEDIKLIVSVNSTGLCVPSLEALLMNQTAIGHNSKRLPIFGLGCLGGVAGINRVHDYLEGHKEEAALVLVTELCSLTYQLGDSSIANLVGTALFGDGAGAVLMVGDDHPLKDSALLEIINTKSFFYPDTEHYMGWKMVETGFEINLSNDIPNLVRSQVGKNIINFMQENGVEKKDIKFYLGHPGGPKVLEAVTEALGGKKEDLALSWESLETHGNMSSVSVINVIELFQKKYEYKKGDIGIMFAMGPAFSLELSLVKRC
jgi:alkylresorcinol/alkylpyrone synthase